MLCDPHAPHRMEFACISCFVAAPKLCQRHVAFVAGQKRPKLTDQPRSATPITAKVGPTFSNRSPAKLVKMGQAMGTGGIMRQRLIYHLENCPGVSMLRLKDVLKVSLPYFY